MTMVLWRSLVSSKGPFIWPRIHLTGSVPMKALPLTFFQMGRDVGAIEPLQSPSQYLSKSYPPPSLKLGKRWRKEYQNRG